MSTPKDFSALWKEIPEEVSGRLESSSKADDGKTHENSPQEPSYFPLMDTFRLYAGWLLAWYFLIYALGSYQYLKSPPFNIPYVADLFLSPLIANASFATFLFLLFSSIHRRLKGGAGLGIFLTIIALALIIVFYQNI